jgi:lysophospholipase L1-like esterase
VKPRIHFYGDSYIAGFGDPRELGWVGRIATRCPELEFVNHGVPGETSLDAVTRFDNTDFDERDRVVVFSFGSNDVILNVSQDQSVLAFERAIERCRRHDLNVLLVLPPAIHGLPAVDPTLEALSQTLGTVASANSIAVFSARALLDREGAWYYEAAHGDGAHPGAEGYAELAHRLIDDGLPAKLDELSQR